MTDGIEKAIGTAASSVTTALDHLFHPVGPKDVFSAPIKHDGTIVVTASALERHGGFGFGGGADSDLDQSDGGGGGGGGGSMNARPIAVISVTDEGVTVVPVFDMTRIALAALGVVLALLKAMRR